MEENSISPLFHELGAEMGPGCAAGCADQNLHGTAKGQAVAQTCLKSPQNSKVQMCQNSCPEKGKAQGKVSPPLYEGFCQQKAHLQRQAEILKSFQGQLIPHVFLCGQQRDKGQLCAAVL